MTSAAPEPVKAEQSTKMKANRLLLVNLSAQHCKAWLDAVRQAGQPWHKEVVNDLAKAKLLLKEHPKAHVVVCYDAPEQQVAGCIAKERLPSQALANWINDTESLLDLYRDHFERMTLVRREALEQNAKELFSQLTSRSGIALGRVSVKTETNQGDQAAIDEQEQAAQRLMAARVLQHSSAEPLLQELEVSTLPLLESKALLDVADDVYEVLAPGSLKGSEISLDEVEGLRKEKQSLENKLKEVQAENDLVIEQLHKTQEDLEQYILGNKGGAEKLKGEIQKKNEKLHAFSQKNKRLMSQLKEARQQLKELKRSKSWKVTAPLRKSVKALGGGSK